MSSNLTALPAGEACALETLIAPTPGGIASRILAKKGGGSVTLFAFDAGQGLTEHTSPFDALVLVLPVCHMPSKLGSRRACCW